MWVHMQAQKLKDTVTKLGGQLADAEGTWVPWHAAMTDTELQQHPLEQA
jgi:hypothetical protein